MHLLCSAESVLRGARLRGHVPSRHVRCETGGSEAMHHSTVIELIRSLHLYLIKGLVLGHLPGDQRTHQFGIKLLSGFKIYL
jgi:hypothetical protein